METPVIIAGRLVHNLYTTLGELVERRACCENLSNSDNRKALCLKRAAEMEEAVQRGEKPRIHTDDRELYRALRCHRGLLLCEQLPQRIASFLSLMAGNPADAILFYYSKGSDNAYRWSLSAITKDALPNKAEELGNYAEVISRECSDEGYSLTLAFLIKGLEMLGILPGQVPATYPALLDTIIEMERKGIFIHRKMLILEYVAALKRLVDGIWKQ